MLAADGGGQLRDVLDLLPHRIPRIVLVQVLEDRSRGELQVARRPVRRTAAAGRSADSRTGPARSTRSRTRRPRRGSGCTGSGCGSSGNQTPQESGAEPTRMVLIVLTPFVVWQSDGSQVGAGSSSSRRRSRRRCWVDSSVEVSADRYVPPGLAVRRGDQRIGLDVDHRGALAGLGHLDRVGELGGRGHPDDVGAQAGGVGGQVDRQLGAVEPAVVAAVAVGGAEPLRAQRLRQRADRGEAVVLHQHDDDLDALLHGGDQFGGHHQVRAVADHDEHVAVGGGHPDADAAGDLVSHAGVAVFDVIALAVAGAPQLVQVAGHRARRAHHHVARIGQRVGQPDHLVLVQRAAVVLDAVGRRRRCRPTPWRVRLCGRGIRR